LAIILASTRSFLTVARVIARVARVGDQHAGDVRLADQRDAQRVAGRQRDAIVRAQLWAKGCS
jgi:hypothetical protein